MSLSLPTLRGSTQQALYGFSRIVSCSTKVAIFNNMEEQRWVRRVPLYGFLLPMSILSESDYSSWLSTFNNSQVLGRYGSPLSITLNGITYNNLALESDRFIATTRIPKRYDVQLRLRQVTGPAIYTAPSVGSSYPQLNFGFGSPSSYSAELPFVQSSAYYTSVTDSQFGPRYSFPWFSGALSGFPSTSLLTWSLTYPVLTDADLSTLETFFLGQQGRYGSFSFTDPISGTTYNHVRFDMDELAIKYNAPNQSSTQVILKQTNNS